LVNTPKKMTNFGNARSVSDMKYVVDRVQRFRVLFEENYPAILRYAMRRGLGSDDAHDLVENTFEVAWRRFDDIPAGHDAVLWLYGVAQNHLRNERRSQDRRRRLVQRMGSAPAMPPPSDPTHTTAARIRAALGALSDDDREIIVLAAGEELSTAQIAAVLGCGEVAARSRLHRARQRMATMLAQNESLQHRHEIRHEIGVNDQATEVGQ
jgi:RNA polymerase sigma factor (sigma-70 family)